MRHHCKILLTPSSTGFNTARHAVNDDPTIDITDDDHVQTHLSTKKRPHRADTVVTGPRERSRCLRYRLASRHRPRTTSIDQHRRSLEHYILSDPRTWGYGHKCANELSRSHDVSMDRTAAIHNDSAFAIASITSPTRIHLCNANTLIRRLRVRLAGAWR